MGEVKGPAFVAGATGFTGREVVRLLCERGVSTVAHVRPDSQRMEEWRERFQGMGAEVSATPWEQGPMVAALKDLKPAYVFALLGTIRARMKQAGREGKDPKSQDYEAVDYGLTVILLRAAQQCGTNPKFVYLSAAGVKDNARSPYYVAGAKVEKSLPESGLTYCIARPSFITGPDRDDGRPMERTGAAVMDGLLSLAGMFGARKLKTRYASTTNVILAEALVGMALDPDSIDRIFESEDLRPG